MSYLLGIYREHLYSPGKHTSNDALILSNVGEALQELKLDVKLATLEEAHRLWRGADLIFSMCQGPKALSTLAEWSRQGARITNRPQASFNTYRDRLHLLLDQARVPYPQSALISTIEPIDADMALWTKRGLWIKRGDVHATQADDVQYVDSEASLETVLASFAERGIEKVLAQEGCLGDEVKFYAVRGGRFFWWFYPKGAKGYRFDENRARAIAERAAMATGVEVFGGDFIISPDGDINLIDLNDWPSFAPCRVLAPGVIAEYLKERFHAGRFDSIERTIESAV